jgi:DNA-binding transcriptional LysR family regulator
MLNLTRVRIFFEVAKHRSFARAADELSYTPSAVSHQIAALERELGTPLVNRGGRPWTLTEAGEHLNQRAASALAEISAAEQELAELTSGARGTVRLNSVTSGLRSVVPPAVAAFRSRHPDVELRLSEDQPSSILRRLRYGEIDAGIIVTASDQPPPRARSLKITKLIEQSLMVAVPTSSSLARASRLTLRQLRDQRWLLPAHERVAEFRAELDVLFAEAGYAPKVMLELDDEVAAGALIAAGLGIGLIPGLAAPTAHPGVTHVPIRPKRLRVLHAVTSAEPLSRPIRTLIGELEAAGIRLSAPLPG